MSSNQLRPVVRTRPLVAVVSVVPLLGEAVRSALEFADVETFTPRGGDVEGLLHWLNPDVLIVDSEAAAEEARAFAGEHELPILHLSVQDRVLRLYRSGAWETVNHREDGPTPEGVRNVVAGALFARPGAAT
jgi:hypothetical protein